VATDVSAQTFGPILKGQADQNELFLGCLTLENGTDRFSQNVGNWLRIYAV
jgi:hypothetical protein